MELELIPTAQLKFDDDNANGHEQGVDFIANSLKTFGQRKPLVVWGDNVVIAGNGTLEAAQSIGLVEVYVARVPDDWSHDKARAYALADNKTAEWSEWKLPTLNRQLDDLEKLGYEMGDLGFVEFHFDTHPDVEVTGGRGLGTPIISYEIVFDDLAQQSVWFEFLKRLRVQYPDAETNAERIINAITAIV